MNNEGIFNDEEYIKLRKDYEYLKIEYDRIIIENKDLKYKVSQYILNKKLI